jgi:hypothetical protein
VLRFVTTMTICSVAFFVEIPLEAQVNNYNVVNGNDLYKLVIIKNKKKSIFPRSVRK